MDGWAPNCRWEQRSEFSHTHPRSFAIAHGNAGDNGVYNVKGHKWPQGWSEAETMWWLYGHRVMNLVSFCLNQIGAWHVVDEEGRQQEQSFDLKRLGKNPPLLFFVCENSCLVVLKRVCIHYICRTAIHWCIAVRMAISNPEAVDWALSLALTYPDTLPRARSTPNDLMTLRLSLSLSRFCTLTWKPNKTLENHAHGALFGGHLRDLKDLRGSENFANAKIPNSITGLCKDERRAVQECQQYQHSILSNHLTEPSTSCIDWKPMDSGHRLLSTSNLVSRLVELAPYFWVSTRVTFCGFPCSSFNQSHSTRHLI